MTRQGAGFGEEIRAFQSVEKPHVGRCRPQTALRWFAGEVLWHKG